MKKYIRVVLGSKSRYAEECYKGNYIGADYDIHEDLTNKLPENWKDFNKVYRPIWLSKHSGKSKIAAGLACAMLWTVSKGIKIGDIILSPFGDGTYLVGSVESNYYYNPGSNLQHRRRIQWNELRIERSDMSYELQKSTGSTGTTADITKYAKELEILIGGQNREKIITTDETIENPTVFALEKYLEEFLVSNWKNTELGKKFKIYEEDGELVGQQYPSDTGPIDILAISKDRKTLLVVELKRGRVSDNVVGQIQRYMGYVKDELAEGDQEVKGVIIGLEDDLRIKRALSVTQNIEFYKYKVSFRLVKG